MNYEEKYKQALGIARDMLYRLGKGENILLKADLNTMFPELQKSDDERIRKVLIGYFNRYFNLYKKQKECSINTFYGIPTHDILAWLEKQGREKAIPQTNEYASKLFVEEKQDKMKTPEESLGISSEKYAKIVNECIFGEDEENKPNWTMKDEHMLQSALWHVSYSISNGKETDIHCDLTEWLKTIKKRLDG